MVSYYNSTNMYRHQQAVSTPNPGMHSWYAAGYHHQGGQMPPASYCMQDEQQMWHHHPHSVFHNAAAAAAAAEFPDFMHHSSMGAAAPPTAMHHHQIEHGQLPSPPITVSGSEMSSPGGGNISPQNLQQTQIARPPPARSPYEWIKKTSYQTQVNPGEFFVFVIFCN